MVRPALSTGSRLTVAPFRRGIQLGGFLGVWRLVVGSRGPASPSLLWRLFWLAVFDPAHFVMERKMMLRLRALAEATPVTAV